ncbi:MAG TPA: c-type cytochrome biogenesis protein CcmI [Candidatus Omnitrophota bacterium]|nr:c-type cytochrome biogenesis protein CcmI [Candidatus Omnitrophota bacterium]
MIWMIFAVMVAVALAILVLPLLKHRSKPLARAEYDLAVYKDQLGEIDRDVERGVLTPDQAEAARTEISRRMLAAADAKEGAAASPRGGKLAVAAIVTLVPLVAFGLYGTLGHPGLPDQPFADRKGQVQDMQQQADMFKGMVASLAAKLEQNPKDGKGWAMMGRSLKVLGESDKARDAYKKAIALLPGDAMVRLEYGGLLLEEIPQGSALPPEFVALMRDVNAIDPNQPDALYFLGISEFQEGRKLKARTYWTKLLDKVPEGSEDRIEVLKLIESTK